MAHRGPWWPTVAHHDLSLIKSVHRYEIISKLEPCSFHLDLEIGVSTPGEQGWTPKQNQEMSERLKFAGVGNVELYLEEWKKVAVQPWTEDDCEEVHGIIQHALELFLKTQLPGPGHEEHVTYLTGCRAEKFSLHAMVGSLVLERGYISCR